VVTSLTHKVGVIANASSPDLYNYLSRHIDLPTANSKVRLSEQLSTAAHGRSQEFAIGRQAGGLGNGGPAAGSRDRVPKEGCIGHQKVDTNVHVDFEN